LSFTTASSSLCDVTAELEDTCEFQFGDLGQQQSGQEQQEADDERAGQRQRLACPDGGVACYLVEAPLRLDPQQHDQPGQEEDDQAEAPDDRERLSVLRHCALLPPPGTGLGVHPAVSRQASAFRGHGPAACGRVVGRSGTRSSADEGTHPDQDALESTVS
jgi:hypothetical protein